MAVRLIVDAVVNGQRRIDRLRASLVAMNGPTRTLQRSFGGLQTAIAAAFSIVAVQRFTSAVTNSSDTITNIENQLRAAGVAAEDIPAAFQDIVALSEQNRASIEATGGLFARVLRSSRELGLSQEQALTASTAFQQSLALSGASAQEAASASLQFGQALASGRLQGDELRSILENNSFFAQTFARELGVGVGRLREMGAEGQLTSELLADVAQRIAPDINRQFQELTPTFEQVGELVRNRLTLAFSELGLELRRALGNVTEFATGIGDSLAAIVQRIARVLAFIRENGEATGTTFRALAGVITGLLIPAFVNLGRVIITRVASAFLFLISPIGLLLGALAAIGAVVAVAFDEVVSLGQAVGNQIAASGELGATRFANSFRKLRLAVAEIFNGVAIAITDIINGVLDFFVDKINGFIDTVNAGLDLIGQDPIELDLQAPEIPAPQVDTDEIQSAINMANAEIEELQQRANDAFEALLGAGVGVGGAVAEAFMEVRTVVDGLLNAVSAPITPTIDIETPNGTEAGQEAEEVQQDRMTILQDIFTFSEGDFEEISADFKDGFRDSIEDALNTGDFGSLGRNILNAFTESINEQLANNITGLFDDFFKDLSENGADAFTNLFDTIDGGLGGLLSKAGDVFSSLASTIGDLFSNIGGGGGGLGGLFGAIGGFFNEGGVVPGTGGEAVPIVAHAGEVVLNREQQARLLEGGTGNTNVNIDLGITGNVDRQTRTNVMQMIPEIASQINQYNRERTIR